MNDLEKSNHLEEDRNGFINGETAARARDGSENPVTPSPDTADEKLPGSAESVSLTSPGPDIGVTQGEPASPKRIELSNILIMTLLGIASWETSAIIFQLVILARFPSIQLIPIIASPSIIACLASLLFGFLSRSRRLIIRGALAGLFGMAIATFLAATLIFMFFYNAVLGPYGDNAFVFFTCVLFSPIYGAAVYGKTAVGRFLLVGSIVSIPFGLLLMLRSNGTIPLPESSYYIFNPLILALGTTIGLSAGWHKAASARASALTENISYQK